MFKVIQGYTLAPGLTPEEHDRWLYDIRTPDLMQNPYLDSIVYNTVLEVLRCDRSFYQIVEHHYQEIAAYRRAQAWQEAHPIPPERDSAGRAVCQFRVLCDVVEVEYRRESNTRQRGYPTAKAVLGYTLEKGWTPETYDTWLYDIHTPDLMRNPYLRKISYNTVLETMLGTINYYRISELVYEDMDSFQLFQAWRKEHPVSLERGPVGKTAFEFHVLCDVVEVEYRRRVPGT